MLCLYGLMNGFQGGSQNAYEIPWCSIPTMLTCHLSSSLCLHLQAQRRAYLLEKIEVQPAGQTQPGVSRTDISTNTLGKHKVEILKPATSMSASLPGSAAGSPSAAHPTCRSGGLHHSIATSKSCGVVAVAIPMPNSKHRVAAPRSVPNSRSHHGIGIIDRRKREQQLRATSLSDSPRRLAQTTSRGRLSALHRFGHLLDEPFPPTEHCSSDG
jgi:hypothetical protein